MADVPQGQCYAIDHAAFDGWLQRYGRASMNADADVIVAIFTADATYHEQPFEPPLHGHAAIRRYWIEDARDGQSGVQCSATVVGIDGDAGSAKWHAPFTRRVNGSQVDLDGMLSARFAPDGRCCEFREWWHRRETPVRPG